MITYLSYGYNSYSDSVSTSVAYIIFGLIVAAVFGFICDRIVAGKGYPREQNHGFLWGFFLSWIGIIVCACKQNINYYQPNVYINNNIPQPMQYNNPYQQPQGGTVFKGDMENSGWLCVCGARNKDYEGTCHRCGKSKHEQNEAKQAAAASSRQVNLRKTEPSVNDTAAQIKEYKKLLDDGLITEEEFAAKRKQLLGI